MNIINSKLMKLAAGVAAVSLLALTIWTTPAMAAPTAPVVTEPTSPHSTTTNPIIVSGTADATTTVVITGGASIASTTADVSGNWSVSVDLTASSTNFLAVVSVDSVGSTSATTTLEVTHMATSTPDTTAPAPPVVTFPSTPHSTSTNPISVYGTAEASSTISITGGASTSTATTTGSGDWSASVDLTASSTNMLSITAADASGNVSAATTLSITHSTSTATSTATSSPIITLLGENPATIFACNGYVEPGFSAIDSSGAPITATSTGIGNIGNPGTYTITYTATDDQGHTATTTRTVIVQNCSSGGGGGGGNAGGAVRGIARAAAVTPPASSIAGNAFGLNAIQQLQLPPGQVLGAAIVNDPVRAAQIMAIRTQLAQLISQLIGMLQAEIQLQLAGSGNVSGFTLSAR